MKVATKLTGFLFPILLHASSFAGFIIEASEVLNISGTIKLENGDLTLPSSLKEFTRNDPSVDGIVIKSNKGVMLDNTLISTDKGSLRITSDEEISVVKSTLAIHGNITMDGDGKYMRDGKPAVNKLTLKNSHFMWDTNLSTVAVTADVHNNKFGQ